MTPAWIDVTIAAELDAGELISRLDLPGIQGAWQDGGLVHLYWLCSGILVDQESDILDQYSRRGLYLADRREGDEWVALKLRQPESCDGRQ